MYNDKAFNNTLMNSQRKIKKNGIHLHMANKKNKNEAKYKPLIAYDSAIMRSLRQDKCFSVSKVNSLSFSKLYISCDIQNTANIFKNHCLCN